MMVPRARAMQQIPLESSLDLGKVNREGTQEWLHMRERLWEQHNHLYRQLFE